MPNIKKSVYLRAKVVVWFYICNFLLEEYQFCVYFFIIRFNVQIRVRISYPINMHVIYYKDNLQDINIFFERISFTKERTFQSKLFLLYVDLRNITSSIKSPPSSFSYCIKKDTSIKLANICRKYGINRHMTIPDMPQQNGVDKQRSHILREWVISMLSTLDWRLFLASSWFSPHYLVNKVPPITLNCKMLFCKPMNYSSHSMFGCNAFLRIRMDKRTKLGPRSKIYIFWATLWEQRCTSCGTLLKASWMLAEMFCSMRILCRKRKLQLEFESPRHDEN